MSTHKVGDHLQVRLWGGRIVEAPIKAVVETTDGPRLQVSLGDESARIYEWQIVKEARWNRRLLQLHAILALETFDHHTEEYPNFVLTQAIEHYAVNRRLVCLVHIDRVAVDVLA